MARAEIEAHGASRDDETEPESASSSDYSEDLYERYQVPRRPEGKGRRRMNRQLDRKGARKGVWQGKGDGRAEEVDVPHRKRQRRGKGPSQESFENKWQYTAPPVDFKAVWKQHLAQFLHKYPQITTMEILAETLRQVLDERTGGRMQAVSVTMVSNLVSSVLSLVGDTLGQILANAESKLSTTQEENDAIRKEFEEEAEAEAGSSDERENDAIRKDVEDDWDKREQLWRWGYRHPGEADQVMSEWKAAGWEIPIDKQPERRDPDPEEYGDFVTRYTQKWD